MSFGCWKFERELCSSTFTSYEKRGNDSFFIKTKDKEQRMFSFRKIPYYFGKKGLLNWMSDEKYLKLIFKTMVGYELNLSEPKTFNETSVAQAE